MSLIAVSPSFEAYEPSFLDVLGDAARLEQVAEVDAHEGPVYVAADNALYFTTLPKPGPQVSIKLLDLATLEVKVVRRDANGANGMALDREGRLIVCEQGSRIERARISRLDPASGTIETVVDAWDGLPLNSPNDVVVKSDGTIWFTDPSYGSLQGFRPTPRAGDHVYRHDPATGRTVVVADSFDKPNGLAFSHDERLLYVGDSGANQEAGSYYPERPHHIRVFDVQDGWRLDGDRLFAVTNPGFPDGLKVDSFGRVFASAFSGVQIFAPGGALLGEVRLPGAVNFTFGGADRSTLFITTDTAIWAAALGAKGA
jgi:gluconolactonase